jgi:hypothetical protein
MGFADNSPSRVAVSAVVVTLMRVCNGSCKQLGKIASKIPKLDRLARKPPTATL